MLTIAIKFYAYGILSNLLCLLGLFGNTLTLYILNSCKDMRKQSINIYLTVLALYDNGVLIFSILMLNLPAIIEYQRMNAVSPEATSATMAPGLLDSIPVPHSALPTPSTVIVFVPSPMVAAPDLNQSMPINLTSLDYLPVYLYNSTGPANGMSKKRLIRHQFSSHKHPGEWATLSLLFGHCFNQTDWLPNWDSLVPLSTRKLKQLRANVDKHNSGSAAQQYLLRALLRELVQRLRLQAEEANNQSTWWWFENSIPQISLNLMNSATCQESVVNLIQRLEYEAEHSRDLLRFFESVYWILFDSTVPNTGYWLLPSKLVKPTDLDNYILENGAEFEEQTARPERPHPLYYYVKLVYPLALISQTGSIWTTCLITIERYLAVCHPLMSLTLSTRSRAIWALSILSAMAFMFNLPRFLEVDTSNGDIRPSELRRNKIYYYVYYICLNLSFNYIIPLSLLFALNIKIYSSVRHASAHRNELTRARQSELHLASMLVAIVAIFIACNAPAFLVHCLEPYFDVGTVVLETVTIFSNVLVCFNSAINFVIYCIFGKKFRSKLKQVLGIRGGRMCCCVRPIERAQYDLEERTKTRHWPSTNAHKTECACGQSGQHTNGLHRDCPNAKLIGKNNNNNNDKPAQSNNRQATTMEPENVLHYETITSMVSNTYV